jgi:ribosome-associated translation inhibitor RaiA
MQNALSIDFHHLSPSDFVVARVRQRFARLVRACAQITACHVTIAAPHRHHRRGNLYQVHIVVDVPGGRLAVSHDGTASASHRDVGVALRDAFNAAERRLIEHTRRQRTHAGSARAA